MSAASSYQRGTFAQAGPTPGFVLAEETAATNRVRTYNVPAMMQATDATLFLVASKPTSAEDLYLLAGILSTDGNTKTDVCYAGRNYNQPVGLAVNTYSPAFTSVADITAMDNARVRLITAQLPSAQGTAGITIRLNGQPQQLADFDVQNFRLWSDTFFLGGEQVTSLTFPGTIYAAYLYPRFLREDEKGRTERYLRAKFPLAS